MRDRDSSMGLGGAEMTTWALAAQGLGEWLGAEGQSS